MREIWSGAQTGVDRAALEVAHDLGLITGGWVPLGRIAEDGTIPERYAGLQETETPDYSERTTRNVEDSDATLILYRHRLRAGPPSPNSKRFASAGPTWRSAFRRTIPSRRLP